MPPRRDMTPAPASGTGRLPRSELVHLAARFNAGRHAEMQAAAEKATRQFPGDGIAWKALGTALQVQGKDGLEALRRAVELLPADAEARANLGSLLMGRGELDAAVSVLQAALAIDPRLAPAHCNLGDALAQQGDAVVFPALVVAAGAPQHLRVNFRAARLGVGATFQDDAGRAFAVHDAVASRVERPASGFRLRRPSRQRLVFAKDQRRGMQP